MTKLFLPVLLILCVSFHVFAQEEQPNILVILVDDLGYSDLSCNGGTDIQTPHIDALFDQGIRFDQFYANCTVCSPTRASLLTGCYPDKVGVPGVIRTNRNNSWGYLKESALTLPEILGQAGYKTALIGKWHLGLESPNKPNERGFDFFHGFLGDMMDDYWTHLRQGNNYMRLNEQEISPKGHATDIFSDWAVDYLNKAKSQNQPFFLYLAYNAPHFPIQPPEDWLAKVKEREKVLPEKRAKNVAFVEHLDFGIGKVIHALEKTGLDENTLVIFTSDNGGHLPSGALNGDLRGGKQDMYEGGIRVPTVFVWKNKIEQGANINTIGATMDIYPTLCEIAGVSVAHEIDGISLLPALQGKKQTPERTLFFMRREGGHYSGLCYYSVREGDFKLVQNTPFESMQLFNVKNDPNEEFPLNINSKEFKNLRKKLTGHIQEAGKIPWQK